MCRSTDGTSDDLSDDLSDPLLNSHHYRSQLIDNIEAGVSYISVILES